MSCTTVREAVALPSHRSPQRRLWPLTRLFAALMREFEVRRDLRRLSSLDESALRDIGLSRGEAEYAVRNGRLHDPAMMEFGRAPINAPTPRIRLAPHADWT